MSNFVIALLLAIGCSGWIYSKVYKSTGGQTPKALGVAGFSGVIILIISWSLLGMVIS